MDRTFDNTVVMHETAIREILSMIAHQADVSVIHPTALIQFSRHVADGRSQPNRSNTDQEAITVTIACTLPARNKAANIAHPHKFVLVNDHMQSWAKGRAEGVPLHGVSRKPSTGSGFALRPDLMRRLEDRRSAGSQSYHMSMPDRPNRCSRPQQVRLRFDSRSG